MRGKKVAIIAFWHGVTSFAVGDFDAIADEPPRWIDELAAESGPDRDAALAALPRRLFTIDAMRSLLIASEKDPEIESRGRATCESYPALAPVLASIARADRAGPESLPRRWLEAAIAAEIARRAPLERLVARSGRSTLFTANVVVGTRLPRVDRAVKDIPFDRALAKLAAAGDFESTIALDPTLDPTSLASVSAAELLPSTSGGMLKRWLVPRELQAVDLGLLHLITTRDVEERIAAARERDVDANRRRRIEFDSARLLAERLTTNAPGCDAGRARLWLALGVSGTRSVAGGLGSCGDPAIEALGVLAPELGVGEFARRLSLLPPELGRVVIDALEHSPGHDLGTMAGPDPASGLVSRARFESVIARRSEDPATAAIAFADPALRIDWLVAASDGSWSVSPASAIPDAALVDAIDETAILETLDRTAPFFARRPDAAAVRAEFVRVPDLDAQAAAYEAGVAFSERSSDPPRIPFRIETARAFLLGACRPDVAPLDEERAADIVALCARLAPQFPELAPVGAMYATSGRELVRSAREIARGEELTLRAAISKAAILEAGGDDAFAYALLFELRGANKVSRVHSALYDELFAVASMIDSGPTRWFRILDRELR